MICLGFWGPPAAHLLLDHKCTWIGGQGCHADDSQGYKLRGLEYRYNVWQACHPKFEGVKAAQPMIFLWTAQHRGLLATFHAVSKVNVLADAFAASGAFIGTCWV